MMPEKTLQFGIQEQNGSLFVTLSGELTRDTLLPLWKQRASFLSNPHNETIYWDLNHLLRIDSAGFALLIELLNHYQKQSTNYLINVPDVILTLAGLFGLQDWLDSFLTKSKTD
ncbi:STAS domain-containing protein [[Haemophilus] ducreyi]|uniref:STAS domain-containing protein n=1 Tax=Haemophilus ducreyi TaxID=730 RepID=UPI000655EA6C|nr:STAS domain-containing protein [[Haemophilus] ducreyi]AKO44883.1 NTP binding protein (Contains STAS domain) [[Haemophilus] ducreyi]AKO46289.1 NTP binding protein (Contains STAS domain) [[Haemophilus] ducreyi]AKO47632.1 NTP binding protein (Contains STAS domain) [[Haemophilus] ducreyi]AKO49013.1 NTP binding protein (Contains STAS domain) [[Haemophilus] ducreyi]ANF61801.1 NTP binding protein (Contains STAS domain) [[Haemophilus] ducreyi]